jgi:hypothetical protein
MLLPGADAPKDYVEAGIALDRGMETEMPM